MAQPQNNIQIKAPGFAGINTQDSPVNMDLSFAAQADNCAIDAYGRISSRKGFSAFSVDPDTTGNLGDSHAETCYEYVEADGTRHVLVAGDKDGGSTSVIWSQNTTGNFTTTTGLTATNNNWDFASLSDNCFIAQAGETMKYTANGTSWQVLTQDCSVPAWGLTTPNIVLAAFGHIFVADGASDKSTVQWSVVTTDAGLGTVATMWSGTGGGSINVEEYWPNGSDEIVALAAHNNFLVVFGRRSILVYTVPTDPNGAGVGPDHMYLADTVENIGCIARDSVVSIGTDLLFLDASGVRSFERTLQYQSMDVGDMSRNVRDDLSASVMSATFPIRAVYSPEEAMYLLIIPRSNDDLTETYVFDTRRPLEDGSLRPTKWLGRGLRCGLRDDDGNLQLGRPGGMYKYSGGNDTSFLASEDATIGVTFTYKTQAQDFQQASRVKFPKQCDLILIGGATLSLTVEWYYDFSSSRDTSVISRTASAGAQWGVGQWGTGEYGAAGGQISTEKVNMWGSGTHVQLGFVGTVTETPMSIQEINIQALLGRIL